MLGQSRQSPQLLRLLSGPPTRTPEGEVIKPMAKRTVNKSAVTGRFVSNRQVARSPKTTYKQTVSRRGKR